MKTGNNFKKLETILNVFTGLPAGAPAMGTGAMPPSLSQNHRSPEEFLSPERGAAGLKSVPEQRGWGREGFLLPAASAAADGWL